MSTTEKNESVEGSQPDNSREKNGKGKPSTSTKSKDLSHVPCKFFKVGSCTAGSSCPFSHTVLESGGQKDVCAWFVKGNCKFGHKCALAHILPGQSMSMDKKNKKAAQQAAAAANGGKDSNRGGRKTNREGQSSGGTASRNPLFAGSTAPTRMLGSNRSAMPMPLKASLSPSAPAPPLKDTEFAHFGLPDEDNKLETAPAHGKQGSTSETTGLEAQPLSPGSQTEEGAEAKPTAISPSREGLPVNSSRRPAISHHPRSSNPDFGPIGSPSRSVTSGSSVPRANGLASGTSPSHNGNYPTSPFSAPGTQSVFIDAPQDQGERYRSGIAASLGATHSSRAWNMDTGSRPRISRIPGTEEAVEEDELEDFIPGSLTDLLTPEERSRRMSRSNSNQPLGQQVHSPREPSAISAAESTSNSHRYSRSVPAPSLLGDIRSIWSDKGAQSPSTGTGALPPGSPADPSHIAGLAIGNGTPSSFKSSGFGGKSFTEDQFTNPMLSPSNASAAFLPGLHHHYRSKLDNTTRPGNLYPTSSNLSPPVRQFQPSTTLTASHMHTAFGSRLHTGTGVGTESFLSPARPIPQPSTQGVDTSNRVPTGDLALSPSSRALQAHAPGQSLPQGLAAGYSRIHALPSTNLPSPSGQSPGFGTSPGVTTSWASLAAPPTSNSPASEAKLAPGTTPPGGTTANAALESMFSRLSYSAAAATRSTPSTGSTPALSRNVSGGRQWPGAPTNAQSPLSGPVVTGEDDDLFGMNMDG